jgi:hypothetical protein
MAILSGMAAAPVTRANVAAAVIMVPVETTTRTTMMPTMTDDDYDDKDDDKDERLQQQYPMLLPVARVLIRHWTHCLAMMMLAEEALGGWSTMQWFLAIATATASKTASNASESSEGQAGGGWAV